MAKKTQRKEVRQPGVELHGSSYRYRARIMRDGKMVPGTYKRWPFLEGADAARLPAHDPLRRENALANANAFAIADRQGRLSPKRPNGAQDAEGTLEQWLVRYYLEALEHQAYDPADHRAVVHFLKFAGGPAKQRKTGARLPGRPLKIPVGPRAISGINTDKSHLRSIFRLAEQDRAWGASLQKHVQSLGAQDFQLLLSIWAKGKAKAKTKSRVLDTLNAVWNHHHQFYSMKLERPWAVIKVVGDGTPPKARALKKAEIEKLEAELVRLHPHVRGAIEFLRWTGARRGEATKLQWDRIVWPESRNASPSAHFQRTKAARGTYRARFVYLEPECVVALARMVRPHDGKGRPAHYDAATFDSRKFAWPKSGWVFPAPKDPTRHLSGETVYQAFVRCIQHAGVAHASPHHLRHTKATVLSATVPQAMAQEMLGHEDARTFAIYRHLAEEAGYMARDKSGKLVSADELKTVDAIHDALKKLPKALRAKLLEEALGN